MYQRFGMATNTISGGLKILVSVVRFRPWPPDASSIGFRAIRCHARKPRRVDVPGLLSFSVTTCLRSRVGRAAVRGRVPESRVEVGGIPIPAIAGPFLCDRVGGQRVRGRATRVGKPDATRADHRPRPLMHGSSQESNALDLRGCRMRSTSPSRSRAGSISQTTRHTLAASPHCAGTGTAPPTGTSCSKCFRARSVSDPGSGASFPSAV